MIERRTGPPVETHTYLVIDEPSGEAWAIDAPWKTAADTLARVKELNLQLRVILTHGHYDHILDVAAYQLAGIPVALCPAEAPLLELQRTARFGLPMKIPDFRADQELNEGDVLRLGDQEWMVWHVPGHSPGHVILYNAALNTVLGGDLLFQGGFGRVDLPGSDAEQMTASLTRILDLPDETLFYPGHGPETTLGAERPWLEKLVARKLRF